MAQMFVSHQQAEMLRREQEDILREGNDVTILAPTATIDIRLLDEPPGDD